MPKEDKSIQEKVEATPLVPAINAKTGVMQHNEAVIAVRILVTANLFFILYLIIFQCLLE